MILQDLLLNMNNIVTGDFKNLTKFDFKGIYIICDSQEVVYIGSAYARTIQQRLKQYISKSNTGNTLGKSIAKNISHSKKFDKNAKNEIKKAIETVKKFSIYAIKYNDLEYHLIEIAKPKYNNYGKYKD